MLFIHPMWQHENERVGKQQCTPAGYALHVFAEMVGYFGLLMLFATPACWVYSWMAGTFRVPLLWMLAVPFGLGIFSELLYQYSWRLAIWKGFHYDFRECEASWTEAGRRRSYRWKP